MYEWFTIVQLKELVEWNTCFALITLHFVLFCFVFWMPSFFFFFFLLYFTLQYCVGFAIHWHEFLFKKYSVQFSSVTQSCPTLCDPMNRSMPGLPAITNPRSSLRLMSIESVMPSSHLILCRPLVLLPSIPPSIRVFSNESTLRYKAIKRNKVGSLV